MGITITERMLDKHKEFVTSSKAGGQGVEHHLLVPGYTPLQSYSFGLLGPTAPIKGLTGRVQDASFVAHCSATSRSFVFLPTLNGVAPSKGLLQICTEGLEYLAEGRMGASIDMLVISSSSPLLGPFNDSNVAAFPSALRASIASHPLAFHLELLTPIKTKAEAFTVDKGTGAVAILSCPPGRTPKSAEASRFDALFTNAGMLLCIDVMVKLALRNGVSYLYWRQYEGDHETEILPVLPHASRSRLLSRGEWRS